MNNQNDFLFPVVLDQEKVEIEQNSTGTTSLITIGFDGTPASGVSKRGSNESIGPSISTDGRYVAFSWGATNLVPNDTNDSLDVFVRDLQTGVTELVSVATDGTPGNDYSALTSMSSDGRFVAFYSAASNLVPNDTNNAVDIFVRDRQTGITELVSVATDGTLANDDSLWPSISDDGRYVAFSSWASNLVPNNNSFEPYNYNQLQKFVRDRQTGVTELVSVATDGTPANNTTGSYSWVTSISPDGRYVAFMTAAGNLVPNDNDNDFDIFVRDLQQGTTELVSVISDDFSDDYWRPGIPSISADGMYIAFSAYDSRLLAPFPNYSDYYNETAYYDARDAYYESYDRKTFIRDLQTGVTELVSVASNGTPGNKNSDRYGWGEPSISADGRYVAFGSEASNLVSGDTNNSPDIFVRDRQTGITELVSVATDGSPGNPLINKLSLINFNPSLSADGRYVVFFSRASNLVPNDTNDSVDLFVRDRGKSAALFRFRNRTLETGADLFVGTQEKDAILANPEFNQTFALEDNGNPVFSASTEPGEELEPFFRLASIDVPGTYFFVSTEEYNAIFAENSAQRDKWQAEGVDAQGIDLPEFYLYGVGANQGMEFHRFQNIDNNTFLHAGPKETEAIYNDPLLSATLIDQGIAFKSFI